MTPDGESVYGAKAFYNGNETTLYWEINPNNSSTVLAQGDAIFFTTDEYGFVDSSYPVIFNKTGADGIQELASYMEASNYNTADWSFGAFDPAGKKISLIAGVVTDVSGDSITLGKVDSSGNINFANEEDDTKDSGLFTYGISYECNAYIYDYWATGRESAKYAITDASQITVSELIETATDIYSAADPSSVVTNAIALIVDGDVVCIYAVY